MQPNIVQRIVYQLECGAEILPIANHGRFIGRIAICKYCGDLCARLEKPADHLG